MSCRTRLWLSRLHAALLAMLLVGQIAPVGQGGPAALPAWQLAAICHADGGNNPAPGAPADQRHHDHCGLCLTMTGPMLFASTVMLPTLAGFTQIAAPVKLAFTPPPPAHRPYAPRAPPEIA